jgi:hypothetical protein
VLNAQEAMKSAFGDPCRLRFAGVRGALHVIQYQKQTAISLSYLSQTKQWQVFAQVEMRNYSIPAISSAL